ncbi:muts domain V-domain-containing protein [Copromyces sp. CBS 386.78]|nr:muts domain V-domain-containing protein [Copromyces sp. CBS 386.78]
MNEGVPDQSRFPRAQSDDWRRRAISGAAIEGDQRHQIFTVAPARVDGGFIPPRQPGPLHNTAVGLFQPRHLPSYYTPVQGQYDWQEFGGRQVGPGYPVPSYHSHEHYLPTTHDNHAVNHGQGQHTPQTPITGPRTYELSYAPGYGPQDNSNPSCNGNSRVAPYPDMSITAPSPVSSSPYFDTNISANSPATHGQYQPRLSPPSGPRTPSDQVLNPSPGTTFSSSSYHLDGEQQESEHDARNPRASYSKPATPSLYTQSSLSMLSSPTEYRKKGTSDSLDDRATKSRAMSTRSTLLTPVLSDSEPDSDTEGQLVSVPKNIGRIISSVAQSPAPTVSSEESDRVICAIAEGRCAEVVAMAVVNISTGQVDLGRVLNNDRQLYRPLADTLCKLPVNPEKFIVVDSVDNESGLSLLVTCLEEDFPGVTVVPWAREHWKETEGIELIERFALRDQVLALKSNLDGDYYTACAFSAAMKYLQNVLNIRFVCNSLRIRYIHAHNTMAIDRTTAASLELLQNTRRATSKMSTLFGILNNTLTPQGHRLLRTTLLQPSTDEEEITERYEAVEELSANEELFGKLRKALKELDRIDLEHLVVWIIQQQSKPRQPLEEGLLGSTNQGPALPTHAELAKAEQELSKMLMLKEYLCGIDAVHDTLKAAECKSRLLRWIMDKFAPGDIAPIQGAMEETMENDARYSKKPIDSRNNRMWAVKDGRNAVLQQARRSYKDLTEDLHEYFGIINNQFDHLLGYGARLYMDGNRRYCLKFDYSDVVGELAKHKSDKKLAIAGIDVVNGKRTKSHFTCTTAELLQRSRAIQVQADIVTMQSDNMIIDLKERLQDHAGLMFKISEAVALLDMLCSFAQAATTKDYVQPIIKGSLVLTEARNPIVELRTDNYKANPVYSGHQSHRFQVITGGNMSGKSTFIKSIALIQIMAQMGSFVPAQTASISICDRVFARVSTDDAPENNLGTYGVEMRETNGVLRQATDKSLVIIDELGRGTSPRDGMAIAISASEILIRRRALVLFATHFTTIAALLNRRYRNDIIVMNIRSQFQAGGHLTLPHTLAPGLLQNEDYGIELAQLVILGPWTDKAEEILKALRDNRRRRQWGEQNARQNRILQGVYGLIRDAINSDMGDAAFTAYMRRLRNEFVIKLADAAGEVRSAEAEEAVEGSQTGQKRSAEDDTEADSSTEDDGREKRRREE